MPEEKERMKSFDIVTVILLVVALAIGVWGMSITYQLGYSNAEHYYTEAAK